MCCMWLCLCVLLCVLCCYDMIVCVGGCGVSVVVVVVLLCVLNVGVIFVNNVLVFGVCFVLLV